MCLRRKRDEPGIPPNIPTPVPGGNASTPQKHEQEHSAPPLPLTTDPGGVAAGGAARFAGGGADAGGADAGGAAGGGTEAGEEGAAV